MEDGRVVFRIRGANLCLLIGICGRLTLKVTCSVLSLPFHCFCLFPLFLIPVSLFSLPVDYLNIFKNSVLMFSWAFEFTALYERPQFTGADMSPLGVKGRNLTST